MTKSNGILWALIAFDGSSLNPATSSNVCSTLNTWFDVIVQVRSSRLSHVIFCSEHCFFCTFCYAMSLVRSSGLPLEFALEKKWLSCCSVASVNPIAVSGCWKHFPAKMTGLGVCDMYEPWSGCRGHPSPVKTGVSAIPCHMLCLMRSSQLLPAPLCSE